jgi:hypothetical protein
LIDVPPTIARDAEGLERLGPGRIALSGAGPRTTQRDDDRERQSNDDHNG